MGGGLCLCSAPRVATCHPAVWHLCGICVAHVPQQPRRGPLPFPGTPPLTEVDFQRPALVPGTVSWGPSCFEHERRCGQFEAMVVLGSSRRLWFVLFCFPLLPITVAILRTGVRPGEALAGGSGGVKFPGAAAALGGEMLIRSSHFPPWLLFHHVGPVATWTVKGAGGRGRAPRTPIPYTCPPPALPLYPPHQEGPRLTDWGPGPRANLTAPAPPKPLQVPRPRSQQH